ncbi:MAG: hypothetical protein MPW15_00720 [Candidatus Manganitrophus sp.]|nr:hypothetical protein [Candidatus Manganitrophus sp.]
MAISIPHGGRLINRFVDPKEVDRLTQKASQMKKIELTPREISDLELIAIGVFSPWKDSWEAPITRACWIGCGSRMASPGASRSPSRSPPPKPPS